MTAPSGSGIARAGRERVTGLCPVTLQSETQHYTLKSDSDVRIVVAVVVARLPGTPAA
jgi:hypothetical protein